MFKKNKGFTLIELLIVMAVIAILIAIAIPSFRGMQNQANIAKAQGDLRVVKLAVEAYNATNNSYPTLLSTVEGGSVVQTLPKDSFNSGADYGYVKNGDYYAIWSIGPSSQTTACTISTAGVVTVGGDKQIGTTNGTIPNSNWK